jgi:hypothetical protein
MTSFGLNELTTDYEKPKEVRASKKNKEIQIPCYVRGIECWTREE